MSCLLNRDEDNNACSQWRLDPAPVTSPLLA
jgi:hypothetical protein